MDRLKKVISLVLLILVAFSATGLEHGFAGECDHSTALQPQAVQQHADCHDEMMRDDMPRHQTSPCRCDTMLSCTAIILPELSAGASFSYSDALAFYSRSQIPEEYLTRLLAPPPKELA